VEGVVRECFASFSNVVEIDPASMTGDNFADLRLLLEVNDRLEIPFELRISAKARVGREGCVVRILPIRVWPQEYQVGSDVELASFFGPPPPPPRGPSQGPTGPFSRRQQGRPAPHHLNIRFPPLSFNHAAGAQLDQVAAPALVVSLFSFISNQFCYWLNNLTF